MAFDNLTKREKNLLIFGVTVIIAVVFYMLVYTPLRRGLEDKRVTIENQENQITQKLFEIEQKQKLEKEYQLLLKQTGEKTDEQLLFRNKEFEFIKQLNTLANQIGLELFNIEVNKPEVKENIHAEFPVHVFIEGTYGQVINYIGEIENSEYAIRIESLSLNSSFVSRDKEEETIEARLDLIGYGQNEVSSYDR